MMSEVRVLGPTEAAVPDDVAAGVFDSPVSPGWAAEFFADARHHLAVALDAGRVVGMASGVHDVRRRRRSTAIAWPDIGDDASHS